MPEEGTGPDGLVADGPVVSEELDTSVPLDVSMP